MIQQALFPEGEKQQNILVPNSVQSIALALPSLPEDDQKGRWLKLFKSYQRILYFSIRFGGCF